MSVTVRDILVYTGPGVSQEHLVSLDDTLRGLFQGLYNIEYIPSISQLVSRKTWKTTTELFIIPGGRDLFYCQAFSEAAAIAELRDYVIKSGGKYLGLCGGAYFGADVIEFEKGRKGMEVLGSPGERLSFWEGKAVGTLFPNTFEYDDVAHVKDESGVRAVRIYVPGADDCGLGLDLKVYYHGGPYFIPKSATALYEEEENDLSKETTVLAYYVENKEDAIPVLPNDIGFPTLSLPSIVQMTWKASSGKAILSGVHIEVSPLFLPCPNQEVGCLLKDEETKRRKLLVWLFGECLGMSTLPICGNMNEVVEHIHSLVVASRDHDEQSQVLQAIQNHGVACPDGISIDQIPQPRRLLFDLDEYFASLHHGCELGRTLIYSDCMPSTQTLLESEDRLTQHLPTGCVCLASHQTRGRGRGPKTWLSSLGCLQFTLLYRCSSELLTSPVLIQYYVGLALLYAIQKTLGYEDLGLRLKWPNDLYTEDGQAKLAGSLIQSQCQQGLQTTFLIGVGVNVDTEVSINDRSTSLNTLILQRNLSRRHHTQDGECWPLCTREQVMAAFLREFSGNLVRWAQDFDAFEKEYTSHWLHSDQVLFLKSSDQSILLRGLTPQGYLRAELSTASLTWRQRISLLWSRQRPQITLQPDSHSLSLQDMMIVQK